MPAHANQNKYVDHLAKIILLLPLLLAPIALSAQKNPVQETVNQYEKVYLHLDKAYYTSGEDIWFKVYLMDGFSQRAEALSEIVYVELIDPINEIVVRRTIKTSKGSGAGDFKLPIRSMGGEYTIRAYTSYMRNFDADNFFRKKIYVNSGRTSVALSSDTATNLSASEGIVKAHDNVDAKLDLQFFPEGGYMVDGFLNHIAFKAVGADGKGIDLTGAIIDGIGNKVIDFKADHLGMGLLQFIPKEGKNYRAAIEIDGVTKYVDLPASLKQGTLMTVVDANDHYRIDLRSSVHNGIGDFSVVGKQKNVVVLNATIGDKKLKNAAVVNLPKDSLGLGIVQFTLFDSEHRPVTERLVFHLTDSPLVNSRISSSKNEYNHRELVTLEIDLATQELSDLQADLSLSVTDIDVSQPEFHALDITTYLLLNSELRGEIEAPGYYFHSMDPGRKGHLDLLMMTQGWRKFVMNEPLSNANSGLAFLPETGINLEGSLKNPYDLKKPFVADISLTYSNAEEIGQDKVITDGHGRFIFRNLNFADTTSVIIESMAKTTKGKNANGNANFIMKVDSASYPEITIAQSRKERSTTPKIDKYLTKPKNAQSISRAFSMSNKTIQLDEAVVKASKPKPVDTYTRKRKSALYLRTSFSIDFKKFRDLAYSSPLIVLQGRVPGVRVVNDKAYMKGRQITYAGGSEPLYLLDGFPTDSEMIAALPVSEIDFIDIIDSSRSAIYGLRGGNGIIAIYTLDGMERFDDDSGEDDHQGTAKFNHPGFSHARKFYEPVYNIDKPEHNRLDVRTTLCWRPNIQVDQNGKAAVSFYTADTSTEYKVRLEGMTAEGKPIKTETFFEVNDMKDQ